MCQNKDGRMYGNFIYKLNACIGSRVYGNFIYKLRACIGRFLINF